MHNNKVQISSQDTDTNTVKEVYKLYGKLFGCTKVFAHNDLLSGNILLMLNRSDTEATAAFEDVQAVQTEQLSSVPQHILSSSNAPPSMVSSAIGQSNINNSNNTYQSLKKSSRKSIIVPPPSSTTVPLPTNPTTNTLTHTNAHNINKQVVLIDFEYASYNLRSWDIANHFCECAGFDADFEHDFPCIMQRNRFYKAYVIATSTCIESYITPSPATSSSTSATAGALSRLQCMFSSGNDDIDTETADAAMWAERVYTVVNEVAGHIDTTGGADGSERGREKGSGEEMKGVDIDGDSEAKLAAFLKGFDVRSNISVCVYTPHQTCLYINLISYLYICICVGKRLSIHPRFAPVLGLVSNAYIDACIFSPYARYTYTYITCLMKCTLSTICPANAYFMLYIQMGFDTGRYLSDRLRLPALCNA